MTSSIFILLCNHHHHPFPELILSSQTETLSPLNTNSPSPSTAPGPHLLLSVSMNLTPPGTSYKWNHTLFVLFCDWLISLSIMSSSFIYVVAGVRISFLLRLNNNLLYGWSTFCLSIHPSMDMGCFHLLATVSNAAVNMGVQISLQDPAFNSCGYRPRSGIAGSHGNFIWQFYF